MLTNALKFTPANGEIQVKVQVSKMITISISDTGLGMSQQTIRNLFKIDSKREDYRFEGVNGEKGSGIGLILCHDMVRKNGGTIDVKSELGKGSTFSFTVPIS